MCDPIFPENITIGITGKGQWQAMVEQTNLFVKHLTVEFEEEKTQQKNITRTRTN